MSLLELRRRVETLRGRFWVTCWPAILFLAYLGFTILLFARGPISYPISNPWRLFGFLAFAQLAFAGGYLTAVLWAEDHPPRRDWSRMVPALVALSSILNVALLIPSTLFMTEGSLDVLAALEAPADAYSRSLRIARETTNPFAYPALVAAPILYLLVPLTLFYWRRLPWIHRALAILAIAVTWCSAVLLGRNKGFADLFLLFVLFFLVHVARGGTRARVSRYLLAAFSVLVTFLLFFGLFRAGVEGRMPNSYEKGYVNATGGYLEYDNVFLKPFHPSLKPAAGQLSNYLTQGYYGLSLALDLDFVWTRGLGNSFFLHMVEERALNSDFARSNCYPARVEERFGYGMYRSWHTAYPWLASDLSFPGTLLFVFLVGMALALSWKETIGGQNPFSVAMFATVGMMLFYFNANNQALGFPVQFSATVGTAALWLWTRRAPGRRGA